MDKRLMFHVSREKVSLYLILYKKWGPAGAQESNRNVSRSLAIKHQQSTASKARLMPMPTMTMAQVFALPCTVSLFLKIQLWLSSTSIMKVRCRSASCARLLALQVSVAALLLCSCCTAFLQPCVPSTDRRLRKKLPQTALLSPLFASKYVPPVSKDENILAPAESQEKPIYPNVGDLVRYYDLDGGKADGQVLVGKVTFIQKNVGREKSGWTLEVTELEDLGEGYYADYPARVRNSKRTLRDLAAVNPLSGTFVRTENAFKVPYDKATGKPRVRAEQYDIEGYEGPFSGANAIDQSVLEQDAIMYSEMKGRLLRAAALAGLAGTLVADLTKGPEDAIIYAAGVVGSLVYLLLLSIKADTVASPGAKFGKSISNLRWAMPLFVLIGVALYDQSLGDANPVKGKGLFDYITAEQYAAAVLGFLTYRVPLFLLQILDSLKDDESGEFAIPGSTGIAIKLAKGEDKGLESTSSIFKDDSLPTILLVSGPQASGRSDLVRRLIAEGEGRYVEPQRVDRVKEGAKFERLEQREEFLKVDASGRYGLTRQGIVASAKECDPGSSVVVVDADADLARQLAKIGGVRLVGVWVGLESVQDFEDSLGALIDSGEIEIPEGETREVVMRSRIREIVQEIEFGISSGIFEFTILNKNEDESLKQLREAAAYCFK